MSDTIREVILPKLDGIKPGHGGSFMARCPAHTDGTASLSISPGRDQPVVINCHAGCDRADILDALGLTWKDLSNPRPTREDGPDEYIACGWDRELKRHDWRHRKVAEYEYRDATGQLVFAVARCALKGNGCQGFRQWHPDTTKRGGKSWKRTRADGTKVGVGLPYRLPELLAANPSLNRYIVEGEKDADRLWSMGIPATCNAEGAGKWTQAHADHFGYWDYVIVADRDIPGWRHADHVVSTLMATARSIEVVRAAVGKDLSDHLDAGLRLGDLFRVTEPKAAPVIDHAGRDLVEVAA